MGKYSEALKKIGNGVDYYAQIAMRRFVLDVIDRMERFSISRAKLAESLGTSPAYVSKAMRGDVNFTLETMTKLALATGGRLDVRIVDSKVSAVESSMEVTREDLLSPVALRVIARTENSQVFQFDPANEPSFGEFLDLPQQVKVACGF